MRVPYPGTLRSIWMRGYGCATIDDEVDKGNGHPEEAQPSIDVAERQQVAAPLAIEAAGTLVLWRDDGNHDGVAASMTRSARLETPSTPPSSSLAISCCLATAFIEHNRAGRLQAVNIIPVDFSI